MTDDELEALTAPTFYQIVAPLRAGFSVTQGDRDHRCGRCANPFTDSGGNPECVNARRASQVVPYVDGDGPEAA